MTETLQKMEENRDENRKLLKQKKSLIIKQISAAKSIVLKYLDDIEERLITEVGNIMLTTKIINLDVCVYFTVYFRRWWYS
jgi:hypothetical protein